MEESVSSLPDWFKYTYVVLSSVGAKSATVASLTQLHCERGVGKSLASNLVAGNSFGQSAGLSCPRSTIVSIAGLRSS